jgi:RimJ/RimL family protein N-acetyltransferase
MSIDLCHFSDLVVLETDRLILSPLNKNFLSQQYVDWMNDKKVIKHLESGGDYTIEKLSNYLEEVEHNPKYFWAISVKKTNNHIGNIKIDPIDLNNFSGEYGLMIGDRKEWGKGIAKEASERIIDYCFNSLNLKKLNLGVKKNNLNAIRLYKKLGFTIENSSKLNRTDQEYYRMLLYNTNRK